MQTLAPTILWFDSLPSTNTEAAAQASRGAPEGLCVVALEQTAGRGRLDRQWASPAGGLYFSLVLRPRIEIGFWSLLPLMAALGVHDALQKVCGINPDIKWPNDLLVDGRKLCGILAETVESDDGRAVILGIGINLTAVGRPRELEGIATSVQEAGGRNTEVRAVLQGVLAALAARYESLQSPGGGERIRSDWMAHSSYAAGRRVLVTNGSEAIAGTTRGLETDGALRVETDAGEIRTVRTGEVTGLRELEE